MEIPKDGSVNTVNTTIPNNTELITITHNESSTGVCQSTEDIYTIRSSHPEALLAIDAVSSLPIVDFDYTKVDSVYFSIENCFGLPAGLGVWLVNERCLSKHELMSKKKQPDMSYQLLGDMVENAKKNQTHETPNVLSIYLLGMVAMDMLNKGIDMIRRETDYKAAVLYHTLESHEYLSPFIVNRENRSKTVIVAKGDNTNTIISAMEKSKMVLGGGYGKYKDDHIRIANFPTHSKEQIEMLADKLLATAK